MLLVTVSMPYCVRDDAEKYMITLEKLFSSQQEVRVGLHSSKIVHDCHIRSTEVKTHALEIRTQEAVR
jgi:ketopantoate hydroxymethyltransferase